MKTEEEARKCWCPFVRVPVGSDPVAGNHASNRYSNGRVEPEHFCIASNCMAWRWSGSDGDLEKREFSEMGRSPNGEGWTCVLPDAGREGYAIKSRWERPNLDKRGYCGLAGTP